MHNIHIIITMTNIQHWYLKICGIWIGSAWKSSQLKGQSWLESSPNWPVNEKVSRPVDSQKEVTQSYRDLDPDHTSHTTSVRVVLVELVLAAVFSTLIGREMSRLGWIEMSNWNVELKCWIWNVELKCRFEM